MINHSFFIKLGLFFFLFMSLQTSKAQTISWTDFESLGDSLRQTPKPLLIFVKAKWCKYCKMQENSTFKDKKLQKVLNENFYCLKLDAESTKTIKFLNRTYQSSQTAYHQLAEYLAKSKGEVTLPTTLIFDKKFRPVGKWTSFVKSDILLELISKL